MVTLEVGCFAVDVDCWDAAGFFLAGVSFCVLLNAAGFLLVTVPFCL